MSRKFCWGAWVCLITTGCANGGGNGDDALAASSGSTGGGDGATTGSVGTTTGSGSGGAGGATGAGGSGGSAGSGSGGAPSCDNAGQSCASDNPCVAQSVITCVSGEPLCQPSVWMPFGNICGAGSCDGGGLCQIYAEDPNVSDWFGLAVDIDGPHAIGGSPQHDSAAFAAGAVFLLDEQPTNGNTFVYDGWLVSPDAVNQEQFGTAVAVSGDFAVVGDPDDGADTGAAYVLELSGNTWTHVAKLVASDAAPMDNFGESVAIDGDTIVVGTPSKNAAHVFVRSGSSWNEIAQLTGSDTIPFDDFGAAVAIDGTTIAVGASWYADFGAAYVFDETAPGVWSQTTKLQPTTLANFSIFGSAIDITGDVIVVGAMNDTGVATETGTAHVYERVAGVWNGGTKLSASDGLSGDAFGLSVTTSGAHVVVGSAWHDDGSGAAYVFTKLAGAWPQSDKLVPQDSQIDQHFARSVAMDASGQTIIGAFTDDDVAPSAGAIYLWNP